MNEKIRKHIFFYGRVQGVGFRYYSVYKSRQLGLTGWVRNLYDGTVEMEIKSMTEPDNILPENKSIFLSITSKKDTDVSLQYTYDTYGKEGALFCCELKEKNGVKTTLEPLSSFYLSQTSEENYKETWLTNGVFLKKGENVFYLNGKDQTFPYRMILKVTFFEPEKIDSVILYPIEK